MNLTRAFISTIREGCRSAPRVGICHPVTLWACRLPLWAPENARERVDEGLVFTFFGDPFNVNELWGKKEMVDRLLRERFKMPGLFGAPSA